MHLTKALLLTLLLPALQAIATPEIGYATFNKLGEELYVAGLFAELQNATTKDASDLRGKQRIALKILADKISSRKLSKMFTEGAVVNNSSQAVERNLYHLDALKDLIKGRLERGDLLSIDFDGVEKITVNINYIEIGELYSSEFFRLLLNSWVGPVPPSSEFRNKILGLSKFSDSKTIFENLAVADSRLNLGREWKPDFVAELAQQSNQPAAPSPQAVAIVNKPENNKAAIRLSKAANKEPHLSETEPGNTSIANTTLDSEDLKELSLLPPAEIPLTEETQLASAADAEEFITTKKDIDLEAAFSQRLAKMSLKDIIYPRRAMELGQTDTLTAQVTISRSGKLQELVLLKESRYGLLNRAVKYAVNKTKYPPLPETIAGEIFSFTFPVAFKLEH